MEDQNYLKLSECNINDENDVEKKSQLTKLLTDELAINDLDQKEQCGKEEQLMKAMGLPTSFSSTKRFNKRHNKTKSNPLEKYYKKRYSLFSKYDKGIKMDLEAWYSVTPEKLARYIARRCIGKDTYLILDPFCGVGGNVLAFASISKKVQVIAMDISPEKIEMARHNAKIYEVEDRINFIVDDFLNLKYHRFKPDFIFLSPPWGGPNYASFDKFSLSMMNPDGTQIFQLSKQFITPNIAFYLPRNIDLEEINQLLTPGDKVEIEENFVNSKVKTITAYFGNLIDPS